MTTPLHTAAREAMQALEHARDWIEGSEAVQPITFYECENAVNGLREAIAHVDATNTSPERVQISAGNVHVMQQALDALEQSQKYVEASANAKLEPGWGEQLDRAEAAIEALREAIKEQA